MSPLWADSNGMEAWETRFLIQPKMTEPVWTDC